MTYNSYYDKPSYSNNYIPSRYNYHYMNLQHTSKPFIPKEFDAVETTETETKPKSTKIANPKEVSFANIRKDIQHVAGSSAQYEVIPSTIDYTKYVSLTNVNFRNNQIKSVPIQLFKLPALKLLDLSNNYLESLPKNKKSTGIGFNYGLFNSPPLFKSNKDGWVDIPLEYLIVNNNFLREIPKWFFEIKDIKQIQANDNYASVQRPNGTRNIKFENKTSDKGLINNKTRNVNGTIIEYDDSSDEESDKITKAIKIKQLPILQKDRTEITTNVDNNNNTESKETKVEISKNKQDFDMLKTYILYLQNENGILKERVKHQATMIDLLIKQKNDYAAKVFEVDKSTL